MKSINLSTLPLASLFFASSLLFAQTENRKISSFDGVSVAGHYDVTLTQCSEGTITLNGDLDDLEKIETHVKNGVLIIKQEKASWFSNWDSGRVTINLPVEDIDKVVLSGSGSISSNHLLRSDNFDVTLSGSGEIDLEIDTEEFEGVLTGSGDISLQGKAAHVSYKITGSGDISAEEFEAESAHARVTGSGDIEMHAQSTINASVTGSGDIVCYGNPKIQQTKMTGSGDIDIRN